MMSRSIFPSLTATLAATALALAACSESPTGNTPPIVIPRDDEPVVYSRHIEPIFQTTCGGTDCHLNGYSGGNLAMNSWEEVMSGTVDGVTDVIPYSARRSHLFQHINTDSTLGIIAEPHMPIGRDPLPIEQIRAIKRWIDEGAKNDRGEVSLAETGRPRIFAGSRSDDVITALDEEAGRVARFIEAKADGGERTAAPHELLMAPDGTLYASVTGTNVVQRYDPRTFARTGSVAVGPAPAGLALSPGGETLYVAHHDLDAETQYVTLIDAARMRVIGTIDSVGRAPRGVVAGHDGRYLYTINSAGDDIGVVDLASGKVLRRIPVSYRNPLIPGFIARYEPYNGVLTDNGNTLWVACRRSNEVRAIDLQSGEVTDSLFVGFRPQAPALTPDRRRLWVPNSASSSISVIDVTTRKTYATIKDIIDIPNSIAFSRDGRTAYVVCQSLDGGARHGGAGGAGGVYVIDVDGAIVLKRLELADGSSGIATTW